MIDREQMASPIAVLDASVLVPVWSRRALQLLARSPRPRYRPVWSEWIIAETWYVVTMKAIRTGLPEAVISTRAKQMLRHLLAVMRLVSVASPPASLPPSPLRDLDDEAPWLTAGLSGAQYLISHNTRDFPPLVHSVEAFGGQRYSTHRHMHQGIEFLTAIEFIEDVLGEQVAALLDRPVSPDGLLRSQRRVTPL